MVGETSKTYLKKLLAKSLASLDLAENSIQIELSVPSPGFGDYATNLALILAKKTKQNPKVLASKIIESLLISDKEKMLESAEEKAGFINFRLSQGDLAEYVQKFATQINITQAGKGQKVVFEYSSPNTNKPLHIGHTRNDVYGLACINLLKALGYDVVSCEIINDRGIHIMKSVLMYIKNGQGKTPESEKIKPDHFVGKFYQMFAQQTAQSPEKEKVLLEEAQELLRKWEAGDKQVREIWQKMNNWFFEGVKQTYEKEGSHFDEVDFESQIYDKGRDLVLAGVKKGVFAKAEDGSVFVDLTADKLDKKTLLRKDGTTLYITQDMYLWHIRNDKHHPNKAMVTTSAEQAHHFKVLKRVFELLEFPWAQDFHHLPYEHVFLGKSKMSSREGNTISADDLLTMIKDKVKLAMAGLQKIKQSSSNNKLIEQVAFAAIKYGYLKYEPNTRIYFDPDQTISLEGNTGPYIQYAHSRIQSILKKVGKFSQTKPENLSAPEEVVLMRMLIHYPEIVVQAAESFKPNILCNFLYELASKFNAFYSAVPVISTQDVNLKNQRLTLLLAVANTISHGLNLLGIEAPQEM